MKKDKLVLAKFRVKINSLAVESTIIRREERRFVGIKNDYNRSVLKHHRDEVVGKESRATLLAYAFYRGVPYKAVESKASKPVALAAVARILASLARKRDITKEIEAWLSGAAPQTIAVAMAA